MSDLKMQLADYFDHVVEPVDIGDILAEERPGPQRRLASGELPPSGSGDDLIVLDPLGPVELPTTTRPTRRAVAAAAAALLLIVGLVVASRGSDDVLTEVASAPTVTDLVLSPTVTDAVLSSEQSGVFSDGGEVRQELASVTAAGPGLVVVGYSSTGSFLYPVQTYDSAAVWTSVDATNWVRAPDDPAVFSPSRLTEMVDVAVGGPGLVAVGRLAQSDDFTNPGLAGVVWTSVDGTTWSLVPHDESIFGGPGNQILYGVTAGGPGLVAVGVDGGGYSVSVDAAVWTSVDGSEWSRVPHDEEVFGGAAINSVTVGGPGLVAVGSSGVGGDNLDYREATEADKNFTTDAVVWTSVDGITWSRVPQDVVVFGGPGDQSMSKVIAGGPGLVAVGSDAVGNDNTANAAVWTSVDGLIWSRVRNDEVIFGGPNAQRMTSVTTGGPGLVAVGVDGLDVGGADFDLDAAVWTSVDGITWSRVAHDEVAFGGVGSQWMSGVATTDGTLVAVGRDGTGVWGVAGTVTAAMWTSTDGIVWSRVALAQTTGEAGS